MAAKNRDPTVRPARAAVALRISGASLEEICTEIGYATPEIARAMIERELGRWADGQPEERTKLRNLANARLDVLMRSVWAKATDPTNPEHLAATKVALSLIDRAIRLHGLDAPQEVVLHSPTEMEIQTFVATMLSQQRASYGDVVDAEVIFDDTEGQGALESVPGRPVQPEQDNPTGPEIP